MLAQTTLEKLNQQGKVYGSQAVNIPLTGVGSTYALGLVVNGYPVSVASLAFSTTLTSLIYRLYEGIAATGGTATKVVNRNRTMSEGKGAPFEVKSGVSFTPDVNKIISQGKIGVDRRESINEIISFEAGLILRPNTSYILEIESGDTGTTSTDVAIILASCGNTPVEVL